MFNLTFFGQNDTMQAEQRKEVLTVADPVLYDRMLFADNLMRLIKQNNEKQTDIAKLLNVSKSTVSAYCSGSQMPRIDKIEQLARHFGVTRGELLGEEAAPPPAEPEPEEELPIAPLYRALNERGQGELMRYGRYLVQQPEYKADLSAIEATFQRMTDHLREGAAEYIGETRKLTSRIMERLISSLKKKVKDPRSPTEIWPAGLFRKYVLFTKEILQHNTIL